MRILVAPQVGAEGVLLPFLGIAEALLQDGHRVYFYGPAWARARAEGLGCDFLEVPAGDAFRALLRSKPGQMQQTLFRLADRVAPDLLRHLGRRRIELALVDGFAHLGAAMAVEKAQLPWASLAHNPWMSSPAARETSGGQADVDRLRRQLGLPRREGNAFLQCTSPWLHLLAWPPEFDEGQAPAQSLHIGPVGWDEPVQRIPRWVEGFGRARPGVLVAVSSYAMDRFVEVERALAAATVEAVKHLPIDVVMTLSGKLKRWRGASAPNLRFTGYLPHHLLIDRCQLLITHGGWGALGRALRAGIPVIVTPDGLDRPGNGARCEHLGLGLRFNPYTLTAKQLRAALGTLLEANGPHRRRALALARRWRAPTPARRAATALAALGRSRGDESCS